MTLSRFPCGLFHMCYPTVQDAHMTRQSVSSLVFDEMWLSPGSSVGEARLCLQFKGAKDVPDAKAAVERYMKVLTTLRWDSVKFSTSPHNSCTALMYDTYVVDQKNNPDILLLYAKISFRTMPIHGRCFTISLPPIMCFWYKDENDLQIVMRNPGSTGRFNDALIHIEWKHNMCPTTCHCTWSKAREIFENWTEARTSKESISIWQENVFGQGWTLSMMTNAYVRSGAPQKQYECSIPSFNEQVELKKRVECATGLMMMARTNVENVIQT